MAIAFWAHNNNALVNNTNLKIHYYPDEEADLYIRVSPVVDSRLVKKVLDSGVYKRVFFINRPNIDINDTPFRFLPKIRRFFIKLYIKKYFCNVFYQCADERAYNHLFVPGLWADSVYFVDFFSRKGKIKISYVDEGMSSVYFSPKEFAFFFPIPEIKSKIVNIWEELFLRGSCRRFFDGRLFLYGGNSFHKDNPFSVFPLPQIGDDNSICKSIIQYDKIEFYNRLYHYNRAQIVFLSQFTVGIYEKNFVQSYNMFKEVVNIFPKYRVVLKNHPVSNWLKKNFSKDIKDKVYVDNDKYIFESNSLYEDFNNKVLVTINSATIYNLKMIYGQEPFVIFLYRLYRCYQVSGDQFNEQYVDDLKKVYQHPEKIFVPNTILEYQMILQDLAEQTSIDFTNNNVIKNITFVGINNTNLGYLKAAAGFLHNAYIQVLDMSGLDSSTESCEKAKKIFDDLNPPETLVLERVTRSKSLLDDIDLSVVVVNSRYMLTSVKNLISTKQVRMLVLENLLLSAGKDYYQLQRSFENAESSAWVEYSLVSEMAPFLNELAKDLALCETFSVDISGGDWGRREEAAGFLDMIHRLNREKSEPILDFSEVKMQVPEEEDDADVRFFGRISGRMGRCSFAMTSLVDKYCPLRIAILSGNIMAILYPSENRVTIARGANSWRIEVRNIREDDQGKSAKAVMEALLTTGECGLTDFDTVVWEHVPLVEKFAMALAEEKMVKKKKNSKNMVKNQPNDDGREVFV